MNLFKLTEKQLNQWETTRNKSRYLYYSKWAIWVCLFFSIIMFIYNSYILNLDFVIFDFVILMMVSFVGGFVLGIINWNAMEYGYKMSKEKK